jgi:1,4-alpha-glucan branching enzyme
LLLDNDQKVIALHRREQGGPGDDVVIIANFANGIQENIPIPFPQPGTWHLRLNSAEPDYGLAALPDQPSTIEIDEGPALLSIPPYGVLIYSQDPA